MVSIFEGFFNSKGFIFDRFPRTITQAEALDTFLASKNTKIDLMLSLDVTEEELVSRLLLRGKDSGRADDSDESIIRNRIQVYHSQTAVAASYYDKQNKYFPINGVGSIDSIFEQLCSVIDRFNK